MSGLSNKEQIRYLHRLASSERLHAEAEKISEERKGYSQIIKNMASDFGKALKERDYEKLLALEKIAQKHDIEYHAADKVRSFHFTLALEDIKKHFVEGLDADRVRQRFLPLVEEFKMKAENVKDKTFDTNINSLCGFINSFKSARCVPAENLYYSKRIESLRAIQKEHQHNIDHALGVTRKERNLSR